MMVIEYVCCQHLKGKRQDYSKDFGYQCSDAIWKKKKRVYACGVLVHLTDSINEPMDASLPTALD